MDNTAQETAVALQKDWGLSIPNPNLISEEELLKLLTQRVVELIERGADTFYQLMYRLDISEKKLNDVLTQANVPENIALLIYTRQQQKIKSRKENTPNIVVDDPEMSW